MMEFPDFTVLLKQKFSFHFFFLQLLSVVDGSDMNLNQLQNVDIFHLSNYKFFRKYLFV